MVELKTQSGNGGVRVNVNAFGAFGSSESGEASDAFYDPLGAIGEAGTVFQSRVAIGIGNNRSRQFLRGCLKRVNLSLKCDSG